jgi:hypothetical protein
MSVDNERRIAGGRRIPIKTIVEIGAGEGGSSAFEAESVNVTASGMHLRTAYLPEVGEPLVCRFEGNGKEIIVQGEVAWRNEEACGGDFGVRFSEIDGESLSALRELTGEAASDSESADAPDPNTVQKGNRVRLHIEGLGSPMKARVREASPAEVQVGSNLEFLKVGRPLDLENVDGAGKRGARIERVNIEVDPGSQIPQLVVALRYLDAPEEKAQELPAAPKSRRTSAAKDSERTTTRMASTSMDEQRDDELIDDEDDFVQENRAAAIWNKVKQVGPVLMSLGDKAKGVVNQAVEKASAFRAHSDDKDLPARRTTSPAPGGGIKSFGRKSVRDELEEEPLDDVPANKINKRYLGVGAAVVMIAVMAIAFTHKSSKPTDATASTEDPAASAAAAPESASSGGSVVAAVPLFGNTPMATNEPAAAPATPPAAAAAATPPPGDALIAQAHAAAPAGEAAPGGGGDEEGDDSADDNKDSAGGTHASRETREATAGGSSSGEKKSFGHGKVHNPVVLSLRMVGNVKGLHGASTATGFTVHVAGTQSKDAAAALKRSDPRIASIRMVNAGNGSDLTVQFKDGVPAYSVRANGANLQIALGRGDKADKKSAKAGKTEHAKGKTKAKKAHGNH